MQDATLTIADRAQQIVDEFALFDDWIGKYEYLIDLGKEVPEIEARYKTDEYKIKGCQSQVWLRAEMTDDTVHYKADSDAIITKGLVSLLVRVLSGQPPHAIATAQLDFLDAIGLNDHLTPTRKNGLAAMVKQMKRYAVNFLPAAKN